MGDMWIGRRDSDSSDRRSCRRRNQVNLERLKRSITMGTINEAHNKNPPPDYTSLDKSSQSTASERPEKDNTTVSFLEKPNNLRRRSPRRGLGALRADEGLGESLDLNIENENSPKLDHHSTVGDPGGVKEGLAACLNPSLACVNPEPYDSYGGDPKSPARRVTFL